jgi:hypothetical protein
MRKNLPPNRTDLVAGSHAASTGRHSVVGTASHQIAADDAKLANWWAATERVVGKTIAQDERTIASAATTAWRNVETTAIRDGSAAAEEWSAAATTARSWWNGTDSWLAAHLVRSDEQERHNDVTVTYLNHSYAYSLLSQRNNNDNGASSFDFTNDYFAVRPDTQINQAYCGVASAAAVLNSLPGSSSAADDPIYGPYQYATQTSLLANCSRHIGIVVNDTYNGILLPPFGLTLDMVASLLECQDGSITATVQHVDPTIMSLTDVMRDFTTALLHDRQRIIVNYHRAAVGQVGGGHFSPLVAKSGGSQHNDDDLLLLISDVAKYKYPPGWIVARHLYESMATLDPCGAYYNHAAAASIRDVPHTPHEFDKVMAKLQCQPDYRGYIIVETKQ